MVSMALVLAVSLGAPAAASAQDPSLAAEWHLDSIAGGTTADSSGHSFGGEVGGSPAAVADGRFSHAVRFPAKADFIDAGNFAPLQPRNVSVLAWVRSASIPATVKTIVAQGAAGSCSHASYSLYTSGSADPSGLRFYIWNGTSAPRTPPAPNTIWDGAWHAVVGTYDGSTVRLYVDGHEVGNAPASGTIGYGLDVSNHFTIGNYAGASTCLEQTQFSGDIDEVRVWDRGLTAAEVAYVSQSGPTTPPELPIPGPPPPPPPTPVPQNLTAPTISALASAGGLTGSDFCNPGTWKNLPSPPGFAYRWVALENGKPVPVGAGQQFTPPSNVYGYPVTCEVTVQGPSAPITATSNSVFFTSAGLNTLPPAYGDVRVRGIDVFQVVQPNANAPAYGWPSGSFDEPCSGGTPTPFHRGDANNDFLCTVGTTNPQAAMQHTSYRGVTLDSDKRTTAIVYVNTFTVPPRDPNLTINVELSGTLNGQSLGDPLVLQAPPLQSSILPWVSAAERGTGGYGVQFHLPSAWTAPGTLKLTAHVVFPKPDFGASYGAHQCPDPTDPPGGDPTLGFYPLPNCDTDDTFTLDGIPMRTFQAPRFQAVQLLTSGQAPFTTTPDEVMAAAKALYPGGARLDFGTYSPNTIDIDAASKVTVDSKGNCVGTVGTASGGQATRVCRWYAIDALMQQWVTDNPARLDFCGLFCIRIRMYDGVLGVSNYDSGGGILGCTAGSFCPEPGFQHPVGNDITKVSATGPLPGSTGWLIVNTTVHPVQGSAHELGHWLTLPHAGSNVGPCKNAPTFETWPGNDDGRLQGARFNPLRGFRAIPQVDGTPSDRVLYDLMTYCADFRDRRPTTKQTRLGYSPTSYPGNAWLSARNWNRIIAVLDAFAARIGTGSVRVSRDVGAASAAKQGRTAFAVGVAGPDGGGIARVVPADGQDAVPPSVPASPYRLRSLGASGQVLLDAGITIQFPQDIVTPEGTFVGPVAANATEVELVHNGVVLARRNRSRPPRIKLLAPGKGIRLHTGQRLLVRWRGSDPDRDALQAMVDFTSDGGKIWRTVFTGPNRGRVTLPASVLAGSKHARLRVTLNDGFSDATATSATFTTPGTPPQAQIITPRVGDTVLAGARTRLSGIAFDDLGQPLKGRALTWFAGRRRLGTGATLKARLPAGNVALKLLARGSNGLTRVVTERLSVTPQRLRLLSVSIPQRVSKKARTVTLTIRMSARSKLVAAGHHFVVRTRATKLTVALPKRPAIGLLKVRFTVTATDRSVRGTIRGAIWVVRT